MHLHRILFWEVTLFLLVLMAKGILVNFLHIDGNLSEQLWWVVFLQILAIVLFIHFKQKKRATTW